MSKLRNMRVIEIPRFRAISSGPMSFAELFGEGGFCEWVRANGRLMLKHIYDEPSFLWHEGSPETYGKGMNVWIHAANDFVTSADAAPYGLIEFPGGVFLVATADEKDDKDLNETVDDMMRWIKESEVFEYGGFPKSGMCNMANPDGVADTALGIAQQQIFLPLKFRERGGE